MNKYNEVDAIKALNKKNGISINKVGKAITIDKTNNNLGNSSWGKIDYLTKVHGYVVVFTTELGKKKKSADDDTNNTNRKTAKREAKLNMVAMTKAAMKKVKDHA